MLAPMNDMDYYGYLLAKNITDAAVQAKIIPKDKMATSVADLLAQYVELIADGISTGRLNGADLSKRMRTLTTYIVYYDRDGNIIRIDPAMLVSNPKDTGFVVNPSDPFRI